MSYIAELRVSLNANEESELREQDFKKIFVNLNEGAHGNTVYLWYKKGSHAITRIQFSFNDQMAKSLSNARFIRIKKNLNEGTGGDPIYLWYYKGASIDPKFDLPIAKLDVSSKGTDEPHKYKLGWERLACNLNRGAGGNWIYLWVKREKPAYICDIKASAGYDEDKDNFDEGYIRVDEDTNRGGGRCSCSHAPNIFIWYRQTTDSKGAISELEISTSDEDYESFQNQNYEKVNQDLNKGTGGSPVFLWYKKDSAIAPIKAVTVLVDPAAKRAYEEDGIPVIKKNLNNGNNGDHMFLSYYQ